MKRRVSAYASSEITTLLSDDLRVSFSCIGLTETFETSGSDELTVSITLPDDARDRLIGLLTQARQGRDSSDIDRPSFESAI